MKCVYHVYPNWQNNALVKIHQRSRVNYLRITEYLLSNSNAAPQSGSAGAGVRYSAYNVTADSARGGAKINTIYSKTRLIAFKCEIENCQTPRDSHRD